MEPVGSEPQQHSPLMQAARAALVALTVLAGIGMVALWGRAQRRAAEVQPGPLEELELEVTANELATAYAYGKDDADHRFKGQWLIVSGTVDSVEAGDKVILRALDSLVGVSCAFESGWGDQLARLRRWDDVVVRCRGKGMVMTTPLLEFCALQAIQR